MKYLKSSIVSALIFVCLSGPGNSYAQGPGFAVRDTNYDSFAFWIGEWDVYIYSTDSIIGSSSINSIMDGFAIEENYKNLNSNYRGTSISKFNSPQKCWEQYYVDNQGTTLFLKGSFKEGKMIMKREIDDQGTTVMDKLIWEPMQDGTVRQTWKQRSGEGSWNILFDGLYRKKNP